MKPYNDIVKNVLKNGKWKGNRTKYDTLSTFCEIFRHDMSKGYPLLTTKKMAVRSMAVELEGFINGITDKSWYQERKCKIWNEWANPKAAKEHFDRANAMAGGEPAVWNEGNRKIAQKWATDLGPIYGKQWRDFNGEGYDQLKRVVETLKNDPNDRRMVVSAWNPNQMDEMALPPCHYAFTLVHINGVLNLCWKQRSCDLMLGVPFNIASYGLLLELLCKESGLKAGELVGVLEDCHIYENHIDGAKEQISREPSELPQIKITGEPFDIFKWTHKDFKLEGYNPHPKINFGEVAI